LQDKLVTGRSWLRVPVSSTTSIKTSLDECAVNKKCKRGAVSIRIDKLVTTLFRDGIHNIFGIDIQLWGLSTLKKSPQFSLLLDFCWDAYQTSNAILYGANKQCLFLSTVHEYQLGIHVSWFTLLTRGDGPNFRWPKFAFTFGCTKGGLM
jgi:hypothetical protein